MIILVDDYNHPCITSHTQCGTLILKNGKSCYFDSLSCSEDGYILCFDDDYRPDQITIAVPYEQVEIIKYGR